MDASEIFGLPRPAAASDGFAVGNLSSRVASMLLDKIHNDNLLPGTRLPSEQAMAAHFGVSRTVIREAIALLKVQGLLETRKGSGAFILDPDAESTSNRDRLPDGSIKSLLNLIEVRRGVEGETAALAAIRRTPGQLSEMEIALRRIEEAVAGGQDGVDQDAKFHQCIAAATGNAYWVRFTETFAHTMRLAVKVTRANEARREDFSQQVRAEHETILGAIAAQDAEAARSAARDHMERATQRVLSADRDFWRGDGGNLVRRLAIE